MLGKHVRIHRLLGKANDIIEIKDGILYLNEQDFDENIELQHFYSIDFEKFQELLKKGVITKDVQGFRKDGKMMVILLDKIAEQNGLSNQIKVEPKNQADKTIKEIYNQNWNMDNFRP